MKTRHRLVKLSYVFSGILICLIGLLLCVDAFVPKEKKLPPHGFVFELGMGLGLSVGGRILWLVGRRQSPGG